MSKDVGRTPRGYDGVKPTGKEVSKLLPKVLQKIGSNFEVRPDLILSAWAELIGPKLAPMTQAVSFMDGTLTVKVKNSSLYSLLVQHEKLRLLQQLQERFPSAPIRNIIFRLG